MNEFRNIKGERVLILAERVEDVCGIVISWFKYYFKSFFLGDNNNNNYF